jgi:hypothetical protein
MKASAAELLPEIQQLILGGKLPAARERLKGSHRLKVPRKLLLGFAKAARQAGLPEVGLRFLSPIIHPPEARKSDATDREAAEFAMCLVRIGAVEEAADLMAPRKGEASADVLLARIFVLAPRWEYAEIARVARLYLDKASLSPAERVIGLLNLGAALIQERRLAEAEPVLREVLKEAERNQLARFLGNALELSAQWAIHERRWDAARGFLDRAESRLGGTGSLDELFLRKWRALLALSRNPGGPSREGVLEIRRQASLKPHWETVRDCDFWLGTTLKDGKLLNDVYSGTPLPSFRSYLVRENPDFVPPKRYTRALGELPGKRIRTLDLNEATLEGAEAMKPGGTLHRLCFALASDFYRPRRLPSLHYHVYPGEFFNSVSSPLRVHQLLWRLRDWAKQKRVPLEIAEVDHAYWLTSKSMVRLECDLGGGCHAETDRLVNELSRRPGPLTAIEIGKLLRTTPRTTRRLLQQLLQEGRLCRLGQGKASRYQIPPHDELT